MYTQLNRVIYWQFTCHSSAVCEGAILLSTRWRTITETAGSYLDATLLGQWIGRGGSAEYPSSSPNLTPPPLEFYLWGSLKDVPYRRKPPTLEPLREEIERSCAAIPLDTSATVPRAPVRLTQKCLQANGGHFEHLFYFNPSCVYQISITNKLF
jgi:hypothetical protein